MNYTADRFGSGLIRIIGPAGSPAASRPPEPPTWFGPVLVGVGAATVNLDRHGRPGTVLDMLGETWTVEAVTGVWVLLNPVPAAAVRTAWRVRLSCWHTPTPGTVAVLSQLGTGSWWLRPPQ